jgi:hypothetical protein
MPVTPPESPGLETIDKAQQMVQRLLEAGFTPTKIASALKYRVSARTVYRWAKGEHVPQRHGDLVALEELAKSVL